MTVDYQSLLNRARELSARARANGQRVVLVNGAFDLLHVGHLRYVTDAARHGDFVIAAINSDRSVRAAKGPQRPLIPEEERLELVAALRVVQHAFIFDSPTVEPVLRALLPHVHAKGTDYSVESVPEFAINQELGIETVITGDAKEHSTTAIAARLSAPQG